MELSAALLFIENSLGPLIGTTVTLIVSIFVIYSFLMKTGVIEHISLMRTYRRRKNDEQIASKDVLIKESRLDETTKKQIIYHQNVLYLRKELDIKEDDLDILKYLIGYIDKKAIDLFKKCRNLIVYNKITQKIEPKDNINIDHAQKQALIGSIIYFIISGLSFFGMVYINSIFSDSVKNTFDLFVLVILSTLALCCGIYIACKILNYFMRLKYLKGLLEMERIE